jgi:hypothetical protein
VEAQAGRGEGAGDVSGQVLAEEDPMKLKAQSSKLKRSSGVQAPVEHGRDCNELGFECLNLDLLLSFELGTLSF